MPPSQHILLHCSLKTTFSLSKFQYSICYISVLFTVNASSSNVCLPNAAVNHTHITSSKCNIIVVDACLPWYWASCISCAMCTDYKHIANTLHTMYLHYVLHVIMSLIYLKIYLRDKSSNIIIKCLIISRMHQSVYLEIIFLLLWGSAGVWNCSDDGDVCVFEGWRGGGVWS